MLLQQDTVYVALSISMACPARGGRFVALSTKAQTDLDWNQNNRHTAHTYWACEPAKVGKRYRFRLEMDANKILNGNFTLLKSC